MMSLFKRHVHDYASTRFNVNGRAYEQLLCKCGTGGLGQLAGPAFTEAEMSA